VRSPSSRKQTVGAEREKLSSDASGRRASPKREKNSPLVTDGIDSSDGERHPGRMPKRTRLEKKDALSAG